MTCAVVFTPKYRRKAIYGQIRSDIGKILRRLCEHKGVEIIEGHLMPDHVHMLLAIPPKYSVSSVMGYLKGKSSLMIFDDAARTNAASKERITAMQTNSGRKASAPWSLSRSGWCPPSPPSPPSRVQRADAVRRP